MAPNTGKRTRTTRTAAGSDAPSQSEIARLYGLPLDEFTPARDALARALRQAGDREAAAEIKALRKPTLTAWALNQAQRRDPARVAELLRAGAGLRDAQQRVVAGGGRDELRDAAAAERRLVDALVACAEGELDASGHAVNASLQGKLRATAHAAAVNDEPGGLLAAGLLVRDYELSDLGLMGSGTVVERAAVEGRAAPGVDPAVRKVAAREAAQRAAAERRAAARAAAERRADDRRAEGLRRQLERARARVTQLEAALAELEQSG